MAYTDVCRDGINRSDRPQRICMAIDEYFSDAFWSSRGGDRRVWWTARRLVTALVLMIWSDGGGLGDCFVRSRSLLGGSEKGQTYQGFVKAWRRWGVELLELACIELREVTRRLLESSPHARRAGNTGGSRGGGKSGGGGWLAFAVDGSRFVLPDTAANASAYGVSRVEGRRDSVPQAGVTLIYQLGLGVIWDWRIEGNSSSERRHLSSMLDSTPKGCLLVMDAGFVGYELLEEIIRSGREVLLRVGRGTTLRRELLPTGKRKSGAIVGLWPEYIQRAGRPPVMLRHIVVNGVRGGRVDLLTSVREAEALSDVEAAELYRERWGVELCYRALKRTLEGWKLRAGSPLMVRVELSGLLLGLMALGLQSVRQVIAAGGDPRRWSAAGALRIMREAMIGLVRRWRDRLAGAVIDGYIRKRKTRQPAARKKAADPPPGQPKIEPATQKERMLAKKLIMS